MKVTLIVCVLTSLLAILATQLVARGFRTNISNGNDARAADRAGIEKLRESDIAATLTQDPGALTTLWSDDGVNLQGTSGPVVGLKALAEFYAKFRVEHPGFKVLKYSPEFKDLKITDGWAMESVDATGTFRMEANGEPMTIQQKFLRVLKRQHDGSWKFALVSPRE